MGLADSHEISWLEWAYCDCGDPTGSGQAEAMIYDTHKAPSGSNIDQQTLQVLDEPYPQVVSGTPQSMSYDAASGVFDFTYSTRSPSGRSFDTGARTVIYTSPLHYPHGYRVSVRGGHVVGEPGRPYLVIAQDGQARAVTVRLSGTST